MSKNDALDILVMLSAIESWALSVSRESMPDYLHENLSNSMDKLRDIVLKDEK